MTFSRPVFVDSRKIFLLFEKCEIFVLAWVHSNLLLETPSIHQLIPELTNDITYLRRRLSDIHCRPSEHIN